MLSSFLTLGPEAFDKPTCRLGLASRGSGELTPDCFHLAIERGVNFLNWPGDSEEDGWRDALSDVVSAMGVAREQLVVSVQFGARTARAAAQELASILRTLKTDYVDLLTFYYVEHEEEWRSLSASGGALEYCRDAKRAGVVRRIGLTSHQRRLAAQIAQSGLLDAVMIRYNAAHRGAEQDLFPVTDAKKIPVVSYTALRWGALLAPTADDPHSFKVPRAPEWYRFALSSPSVAVVLMAPKSRAELVENLSILADDGPLDARALEQLAAHGDRVRRHAGAFP